MAEDDAEARVRKVHAKRKHDQDVPVKESDAQPAGLTRCAQCQKPVHGGGKVCKSCNAPLQPSQGLPAESDSSDDPPLPPTQKAKRVVQLETSSSEDSESGASEAACTRSPPLPPRGRPLPGLQALLQDGETNDQPAVACRKGDKPMLEVPAGSDVWWYVEVVQDASDELRIAYPDPDDRDEIKREWVSRCSSRLWRGPMTKVAWKYLGREVGKGAWRPKAPQERRKAGGKRGRRSGRGGARSQGGTTTQGGTTGGGSSGAAGEEPDVASPQKGLQWQPALRSDGDLSDQSLALYKGSTRLRAVDPLARWFAAHFAALEKKGLLDCEFAKGCPEAGWLPPPDAHLSSVSAPGAATAATTASSRPALPSLDAKSKASGRPGATNSMKAGKEPQESAAAAHPSASKPLKLAGSQGGEETRCGGSTPFAHLPDQSQEAQCATVTSKGRTSVGGVKSAVAPSGVQAQQKSSSPPSHHSVEGVPTQRPWAQKLAGSRHAPTAGTGSLIDVKQRLQPSASVKAATGREVLHRSEPDPRGGGWGMAERIKPYNGLEADTQSAAKPSPAGPSNPHVTLNGSHSKLGLGKDCAEGSKGKDDGGKASVPLRSHKKKLQQPASRPSAGTEALVRRLSKVLLPLADDEQPGGAFGGHMRSPRSGAPPLRPPKSDEPVSALGTSEPSIGGVRARHADGWMVGPLAAPRVKGAPGQAPYSIGTAHTNGKHEKRTI